MSENEVQMMKKLLLVYKCLYFQGDPSVNCSAVPTEVYLADLRLVLLMSENAVLGENYVFSCLILAGTKLGGSCWDESCM